MLFFPLILAWSVYVLVVDLGEGPGDLPPPLILVKKRRNHRRKKSQQGKQNNPPPPMLAQRLDLPLLNALAFLQHYVLWVLGFSKKCVAGG